MVIHIRLCAMEVQRGYLHLKHCQSIVSDVPGDSYPKNRRPRLSSARGTRQCEIDLTASRCKDELSQRNDSGEASIGSVWKSESASFHKLTLISNVVPVSVPERMDHAMHAMLGLYETHHTGMVEVRAPQQEGVANTAALTGMRNGRVVAVAV